MELEAIRETAQHILASLPAGVTVLLQPCQTRVAI